MCLAKCFLSHKAGAWRWAEDWGNLEEMRSEEAGNKMGVCFTGLCQVELLIAGQLGVYLTSGSVSGQARPVCVGSVVEYFKQVIAVLHSCRGGELCVWTPAGSYPL